MTQDQQPQDKLSQDNASLQASASDETGAQGDFEKTDSAESPADSSGVPSNEAGASAGDDPYDVPSSVGAQAPESSAKDLPDEAGAGEADQDPFENGDQDQADNPRKILDALDQQAGHSADQPGPYPSDSPSENLAEEQASPEDLPLPPGMEGSDSDESIPEPTVEDAGVLASDHQDSGRSEAAAGVDPEFLISEAMRRLDQVLAEIEEEEETDLGIPENFETDQTEA